MTQCVPAEGYIHWINLIFGDCVYSTQEAISVLLGYLSILCWLNAQLPQVIENYKIASVDSLSINFLTIWLAGDTANLIGCILTHQLPFQRYLGMYFVFIDVTLLLQWIYYTHKNNKRSRSKKRKNTTTDDALSRVFQHPSARTPLLIEGKSLEDELAPYSASSSPSKWYTLDDTANNSDTTLTNSNKTKTLMAIMLLGFRLTTSSSTSSLVTTTATAVDSNDALFAIQDNALVIGRIFAWVCTTLYLLSRIPQIHKNFKRKSIDGLSPTLFICAACGNLTYTASILSNPNQTSESLVEAIPYLIGSAGTLCFDFTIFCQFLWYWRRNKHHHRHRHHHNNSNHVTV